MELRRGEGRAGCPLTGRDCGEVRDQLAVAERRKTKRAGAPEAAGPENKRGRLLLDAEHLYLAVVVQFVRGIAVAVETNVAAGGVLRVDDTAVVGLDV